MELERETGKVTARVAHGMVGRVPDQMSRGALRSSPALIRYTTGVSFAGEVAESAEGSRLLSGYRGKTSVQGSNPCLSATRALSSVG
jgi:hypothetical protein